MDEGTSGKTHLDRRGPRGRRRYTRTLVFFDPTEFLQRDPASAKTPVEAARLEREAVQRARLCEAMVEVAAARGYEAAQAHRVFGAAEIGSGTFRKLFADKEACFVAALQGCVRVILGRVEGALAGVEGGRARVEIGLGALAELLAAEPELARVAMVEARAGGVASKEAQLRMLGKLGALFAEDARGEEAWLGRMGLGAAVTVVALEVTGGRTAGLPGMLDELVAAALVGLPSVAGTKAEGRRAA